MFSRFTPQKCILRIRLLKKNKQAHTILAQPSTICHISDGQLFICPSYFLITNRFVVMFSFSGLSLDLCPNIVVRADPSSPFIIQVSLISSSIFLDKQQFSVFSLFLLNFSAEQEAGDQHRWQGWDGGRRRGSLSGNCSLGETQPSVILWQLILGWY